MDRLYCTVADLVGDLKLLGADPDEATLLSYIQSASGFIDRRLGQFIPVTMTKWIDGNGEPDLFVDYLLAATTVTMNGTAILSTQYVLYPRSKHWENGPYTRLSVDPDATQLSYWTRELDVISIAGRWGKYEESVTTGTTVANATQIAAGGTSLQVADGSKVSPGMVLLIESEQLLVQATGAPTDSTANTAEALDASEEEIDVNDGTQVKTGEVIRIELEQMKVLDIATNTLLVARGWNGTKRVTHDTPRDVYAYRTFTVKRGVNGTTDAAHANGVAISRYIPPYEINWLAREIAGLMKKKADSGFAGKVGSAELGETFYYAEFPADPLKQISRNYRIVSL